MASIFATPVIEFSAVNVDDPNAPLTSFEKRINALFSNSSYSDRIMIQTWWYTSHECVRCGESFRELKNVGRWQCAQHAVAYEYDPVIGDVRWSCCAREGYNAPGCVAADHAARPIIYTKQDDVPVGATFQMKLDELHGDVHIIRVEGGEGSYARYLLRRFDLDKTLHPAPAK